MLKFIAPLMLRAIFGIAALGLIVGSAEAQQRGRGGFGGGFGGFGGFGGGGRVFMLSGEQIRTELKISEEQKSKIDEISRGLRESTRNLTSGENLSREERMKKFEESAEQRAKLTKEADAKLDGILNAEQKTRLDEISTQTAGLEGLRDEKLAGKLGLTADQKTKITGLLDDQRKKSREMFTPAEGGGRPDFSGLREKMTTLRKETTDQVTAVLTSEQKQKWEDAKGKPFEFQFGGRGGENRPGRGRPENARPAPEKKPEAKESDL